MSKTPFRYNIYIWRRDDGACYVGQTTALDSRLATHASLNKLYGVGLPLRVYVSEDIYTNDKKTSF